MQRVMLDAVKSALNRIRPDGRDHAARRPKSPTGPGHARPSPATARAPYDPHQLSGVAPRAAHGRGLQPPTAHGRVSVPFVPGEGAVTVAKKASATALLDAMELDNFMPRMLLSATSVPELAGNPEFQALQMAAVEQLWGRLPLAAMLDEAGRDLCRAFSAEQLRKLAAFSVTDAGLALFADLPDWRLKIKHDMPLHDGRVRPLNAASQAALLTCVRRIDPALFDRLAEVPADTLALAWPRTFTSDVVADIEHFLHRPEGRAFVDYAHCGCWLGIPNALVVQRAIWARSVRSNMISHYEVMVREDLLAQGVPVPEGWQVPLPQPLCDIPVFVPSRVRIEELSPQA